MIKYNTVHAHTALFGVYGMLGMGFIIVCLRIYSKKTWNEKLLKNAFWLLNLGLMLMVLLSLLPLGVIQTYTSITKGYSYARSAELLYNPAVQTIKWMRIMGDLVFSVEIGYFCWFVIGETISLIKSKTKLNTIINK